MSRVASVRSPAATLLVLLVFVLAAPFVQSETAAGFAYSGAVAHEHYDQSKAISISHNDKYIAASYLEYVAIIDGQTRNFITQFHAKDVVKSLAFTPDNSKLIVGLESQHLSTLSIAIYETNNWQRIGLNEDGTMVEDLSIYEPDGLFAAPNQDSGVSEYSIDAPTNSVHQYQGNHTGRATCVDHSSNGQLLAYGTSDGTIVIFSRSNQTEILSWQGDDTITDCQFSVDGSQIVWTVGSLMQVRSIPEGSFVDTVELIGDSKQLEWRDEGAELWVLTDYGTPSIEVYETSTFSLTDRIHLSHQSAHFALTSDESTFAVTTLSPIVTLYSNTPWLPGLGEAGADFDQDGVPNDRDSDDDGDGIGDEFDIVCADHTDCHVDPNVANLRTITMLIRGNSLSITETVQLNSTQSELIRDLAAASLTIDNTVDDYEFVVIEQMLCQGTDGQQVGANWIAAVSLDTSVLKNSQVTCEGRTGLKGTFVADDATRIHVRWITQIELSNPVPRPFNLTFVPSIMPPSQTIAMATPHSPYNMKIIHEGETVHNSQIIFPNSPSMTIFIDAEAEQPPTLVESTVNWVVANYWIPSAAVLVLIFLVVIFVRRSNRVRFDYFDDDDEFSDDVSVSRRRRSSHTRESPPLSVSRRAQPAAPPEPKTQPRRQPNRPPPDQRSLRKVRRVLGSSTRTGEAPADEEWDYGEHGAYWDADDPDKEDPYGEAAELPSIDLLAIADEMDDQTPKQNLEEEDIEEYDAALSKITSSSITEEPTKKSPTKRKKRRAVKRRKKE